jgi:hypothetical protein
MRPLTLAASAVALGAAATPALAADLTVSVEIPRLTAASYHRPYVAIWLERPGSPATPVRTLAVWYEVSNVAEGKDWLKDMRSWWRALGRTSTMPADGVSSATKAPGQHAVTIPAARLRDLPAGDYVLVAEAARELGGRTVVRVPFAWGRANTASARGVSPTPGATPELGAVRVTVTR